MSKNVKKTAMWRTVFILCAGMALMFGVYVAQHLHVKKHVDVSQLKATVLPDPREIPDFAWIDTDNHAWTRESLRGSWTMMFFGYTHCGYLCPTTMATLGQMYRLLESQHVQPLPHVVMITLDPQRDDQTRLKHYVKAFNVHFDGARGDMPSVNVVTRALGIAHAPATTQKDDIDHTGAILLFNPDGRLLAFFTTPHDAKTLAHEYTLLIEGNR